MCGLNLLYPWIALFCFCCIVGTSASFARVSLVNNSYKGIVVAINPAVPENLAIVEKVKDVFREGSGFLHSATNEMAAFGHVTILLPKTWSGNWTSAGKLTYGEADVIIAKANPLFGDGPYALQFGNCGEPGSYVHLTPDYLLNDIYLNFGARGKVLVHEWAHLRWGVFDEFSSGADAFYRNSTGGLEATRCPKAITGEPRIQKGPTGTAVTCLVDSTTGLYEDGCEFVLDQTQPADITTSLMSYQYLEQVTRFCHNDSTDPVNQHNSDALNEQNRLCERRSVWEVIMSSLDFSNVTPNPNVNLTPSFEVVRAKREENFVLVLDVSGSMSFGSRLADMITAARALVSDHLPNGSNIGIVKFSTSASIVANLQLINDHRQTLMNSLSGLAAVGRTCIGCGISTGIQVLEDAMAELPGSRLIVLTDGDENVSPYVSDEKQGVLDKEVCVSVVFFGSESTTGNPSLQALSEEACGTWFFNEDNNLQELVSTFVSAVQNDDGDVFAKSFQIVNEEYQITNGTPVTRSVTIDATIGNNTAFLFTYNGTSTPDIVLTSPSNVQYCSSSDPRCIDITSVDSTARTVVFRVPGTAETGDWNYTISSNITQSVTLTVSSFAASRSVEPVLVEPALKAYNFTSNDVFVVQCKVSLEFQPVLGLSAKAIITEPDGTQKTLDLFDRGAPPDVRAADGVYSRFFIPSQVGRHALRIEASGSGNGSFTRNSGSGAAFNPGVLLENGTFIPNTAGRPPSQNTGISATQLGSFTRSVSPGGIPVTRPSTSASDVTAPSRVLNLQVTQNDISDLSSGFDLTFTAPGDDLDFGTASRYEIRYSLTGATCFGTNVESCSLVANDSVISGDIYRPQEAGMDERFVIVLGGLPENETSVRVWFALRAHDEANNIATISNVVRVNGFTRGVPLAPTVTDPTTTITTRETTPTTPTPTSTSGVSVSTSSVETTTTRGSGLEDLVERYKVATIVLACTTSVLIVALVCVYFSCQCKSPNHNPPEAYYQNQNVHLRAQPPAAKHDGAPAEFNAV